MGTVPRHVWVDGRVVEATEPVLTAFDRGFQLGDGVFETLRARGGHPTELPEHAARLERSAAGLAIPLPEGIESALVRAIDELLTAEGLGGPDGDASVRITVSRGAYFGRGLLPPDEHPEPMHPLLQRGLERRQLRLCGRQLRGGLHHVQLAGQASVKAGSCQLQSLLLCGNILLGDGQPPLQSAHLNVIAGHLSQ